MMYMFYLVLSYKYTEYKINSNIEYLTKLTTELNQRIVDAHDTIRYKSTTAYKNKILKEEQSKKNPGEKVAYLITEKKFEKYTQTGSQVQGIQVQTPRSEEEDLISTMNIYEKWIYFLFEKDIRG